MREAQALSFGGWSRMFCFPVDKTETHSRTLSEQNDSDDEKGAKVKSKDVENE
jgi:hypothetical protein